MLVSVFLHCCDFPLYNILSVQVIGLQYNLIILKYFEIFCSIFVVYFVISGFYTFY